MEKQVLTFTRKDCHHCEVLLHELYYDHKIEVRNFSDNLYESIWGDFRRHFGINRFPAVQVDDGVTIITIHSDPNFVPNSQQSPDQIYIKVETVDEMVAKTVELYKK